MRGTEPHEGTWEEENPRSSACWEAHLPPPRDLNKVLGAAGAMTAEESF